MKEIPNYVSNDVKGPCYIRWEKWIQTPYNKTDFLDALANVEEQTRFLYNKKARRAHAYITSMRRKKEYEQKVRKLEDHEPFKPSYHDSPLETPIIWDYMGF